MGSVTVDLVFDLAQDVAWRGTRAVRSPNDSYDHAYINCMEKEVHTTLCDELVNKRGGSRL